MIKPPQCANKMPHEPHTWKLAWAEFECAGISASNMYIVTGQELNLVDSVSKRLYTEKKLSADDMRDLAHTLTYVLDHADIANEQIQSIEKESKRMKCEWCQKNEATVTKSDGFHVCESCNSSVSEYYTCTVCNIELVPELARYHRNHFANKAYIICGSKECRFKAAVKRGEYCCEKAENINCVCARSYKCPTHYPHGVHIGTHD